MQDVYHPHPIDSKGLKSSEKNSLIVRYVYLGELQAIAMPLYQNHAGAANVSIG
jgi:hypothetical protein